jgi:cell division protein FtsA
LNDPSYATVTGLLEYGGGAYTQYEFDSNKMMLHKKESITADEGELPKVSMTSDASHKNIEEKIEKESDGIEVKETLIAGIEEAEKESLGQKIKKLWHRMTQIF